MKINVIRENEKLYFQNGIMRLELKDKINLSKFVEFFTEIFAELVIAKYKIKNKNSWKRKFIDLVTH